MRDGVKLHAVIVVPKGASHAPMLLDRTPYGAVTSTTHNASANAATILSRADAMLLAAGYIGVWEDVRGKYGSGGDYVNERPLRGPLNPTKVDHATDAYDTIDWLVKHVPESNGRVGMYGTSYDGMMVAMALTDPHPALKAAVPMNPVINTWMGDDDYHGGAFRLIGYDYYYAQDAAKGDAGDLWRDAYDDYDTFLRAGSAQGFVNSRGLDQLPWVKRLDGHPAYDKFWQAQALETILPKRAPSVPTLWVASQWDQEDMYGAVAAYEALKPVDPTGLNQLVIGPWAHGGEAQEGSSLGAIPFGQDTALAFRRDILIPFLDAHLKDGGKPDGLAAVTAFQTGTNRWQSLPTWPLACDTGCAAPMQKLYLQPAGALGFAPPPLPARGGTRADSYVSDPAKPIPYRLRPIRPTYVDRIDVETVAGRRSAPVFGSHRRADLRDPGADPTGRDRGGGGGEPGRVDDGHRWRFRGEADRRLPGRISRQGGDRRLPIGRSRWTSSAAATARAIRWPGRSPRTRR